MRGIFAGCCARAASGQAAAPPSTTRRTERAADEQLEQLRREQAQPVTIRPEVKFDMDGAQFRRASMRRRLDAELREVQRNAYVDTGDIGMA